MNQDTRVKAVEARRESMDLLVRLSSHGTLMEFEPAIRVSSPRSKAAHTVTYGDLVARVETLGRILDRTCDVGAVIALACSSGVEFVVAYLATLAAGRVIHPIPQNSSRSELLAFLDATGAAVLIGDAAALGAARELKRSIATIDAHSLPAPDGSTWIRKSTASAGAPGLYLPSSGTTGMPKIAVRSRASLDAVARNVAETTGLTPDDRVLAAVPMSHSYGMENGLLGPIWAGSCINIVERNGPDGGLDVGELLSELVAARITVFPAVPFMIDVLAKLSPTAGVKTSLRRVYTAGSPLPHGVAAAFEVRFGVGVGQLYGATEVGSVTFAEPGADSACVGKPMSGVSIRVLDAADPSKELERGQEGQVAIRAESMLSSYLGGDGAAIVDGHFLTGDLGRIEFDGSLTITGRLKLLIDVGGFKVNPLEVEQVLCRHPSIGEAVVVPIAVTETVSRLKAVVTAARPGEQVPVEEVRSFVRSVLAAHKVPRVVEVVDRLPKSPTGKVLRRQLGGGV